jgi:hypothetical protein
VSRRGQRLQPIVRLPNDLDALRREQVAQPLEEQAMVVN